MYEIEGECAICSRRVKGEMIKTDDGKEVCADCDFTMRLEV
jgi:hypothetical protein